LFSALTVAVGECGWVLDLWDVRTISGGALVGICALYRSSSESVVHSCKTKRIEKYFYKILLKKLRFFSAFARILSQSVFKKNFKNFSSYKKINISLNDPKRGFKTM
jgi:hypothetical protein